MLNKLEEFAFGEIGLTPFDFYRMSYREFENLKNGYENKVNREREYRAHLTCWIVNSSGNFKKPIEIGDIIPQQEKQEKTNTVMSQEEKDELKKIIKRRRI